MRILDALTTKHDEPIRVVYGSREMRWSGSRWEITRPQYHSGAEPKILSVHISEDAAVNELLKG